MILIDALKIIPKVGTVYMFNFNNTYNKLPEIFYKKASAQRVSAPELIECNYDLAKEVLGTDLTQYTQKELVQVFSGQIIPKGASSIALAYAGHQFGHFVPQLGDGRALLLGEITGTKGIQFDIQLKGSGPTAFSRNGDGRSSLGPVIREYILSEAMHHLGIPTTRALAATTTGDTVYRDQALPGGIFTRVASSHIRVGTFEYFAARKDHKNIKRLADYAINRHYSNVLNKEAKNIYLEFIKEVAKSQSKLISKWMSFGFIHGVMNTDNMSISGETIDYGPCAFMDEFSFDKVFSSIDKNGRYAYSNQISIAKWNLYRLASCLIPIIQKREDNDSEELTIEFLENEIQAIIPIYEQDYLQAMTKKIGLFKVLAHDHQLIEEWLQLLEQHQLDFTLAHLDLSNEQSRFYHSEEFESFRKKWKQRLSLQPQKLSEVKKLMSTVNPYFIPRNHQVERAIQTSLNGDYSVFKEMNQILKTPFKEQLRYQSYKERPSEDQKIRATFCGT